MLTRAHSHDKAVEIFSYIARYEHSTAYIVGTRLTEWPTKMSTVFLALIILLVFWLYENNYRSYSNITPERIVGKSG